MTYYRLAFHNRQTGRWNWKTTVLSSLEAVFELLRCYRALLPQDRIRVFTASSKEELHEQLSRENSSLSSASVTAPNFCRKGTCLSQNEHLAHRNRVAQYRLLSLERPLPLGTRTFGSSMPS
jgi:hypothetical protein